ncbi:homoserine kinase [Lampropedia puyangensis]|uniref:Homoserine kinase n=1 Tax=Lampropedia puyangensis TaxID=1330072 RepID=A0A4S8EUR0_9BURK|nr:homoserine kinase [Lampropedia puyangensis]THT98472.1 homoserine kinase [Lampropedia puyangensis]
MAVYTEVSPQEAQGLMDQLHLGSVTALQGIQGGIENTNYFVTTSQGTFVLTLFERLTQEQLPFYLHLTRHLASKGIPVPAPKQDSQGQLLFTLKGKPAAVVDKLEGSSQLAPQVPHCAQLGQALARMHMAGQDFEMSQPNLRGLAWWNETVPVVLGYIPATLQTLLQVELAHQNAVASSSAYAQLPCGPVHADLFRDNAMFVGERLSGVFDFYFAGVDTWLFDLSVVINDWCIDLATGQLDEARLAALLESYQSVRPLTQHERALLPDMLRAAALRFWISRLWDFYLPREASMLLPHDPTHFERVLKARIAKPVQLR